ncbi:GNAT family N-acetyltransferase [Lentibacter sp. XHP0401]|jgi:GNAT superfamily N-acetyltransferase|uniref:GNAT family N-acetyltransferase n=1 Tax=Lentibacter sp. XHP0401 TaxID=2984334 RepID=UPI0021E87959|nr:GNAT family N-acetyltransferase [Lentibacter sp. XHP0401]MCV2892951.1 GNAT family N-acetyltransferase [Lentibacter sp. XHP0401]
MSEITLREFHPDDAGWLATQHGILYTRDEGFDASFEILVAEILADFIRNHDPVCERGWIAEQDGVRLGSIFCVRLDGQTAKLRLFLLMPEARGKGLGRRLLSECMSYAKSKGYTRMQLWTHESHKAACALYAKTGWSLVSSKAVHSFGADRIEQSWEIGL